MRCAVVTKELITVRLNDLEHVPVRAAVLGSWHSGYRGICTAGNLGLCPGLSKLPDLEAFPGVFGKF